LIGKGILEEFNKDRLKREYFSEGVEKKKIEDDEEF